MEIDTWQYLTLFTALKRLKVQLDSREKNQKEMKT